MNTKLFFVTSNQGKIASAQRHLEGSGVEVVACKPDFVEPQADSIVEVALSKAKQVKEHFDQPFFVLDSGLVIPGLKGFPGVYTKQCDETIGAQGILAVVERICPKNREAYFEHTIVYWDGADFYSFSDKFTGAIGCVEAPSGSARDWSSFARIFIPTGTQKTISQLTPEELTKADATCRIGSCWGLLKQQLMHPQKSVSLSRE